ncbi:Myc-type, basic helix-loop-helix (bHLH) domain containing protein [Parasponia andersonii]|uniref:Myc-type, basic helix-loop-helix (BHLH) domain containing protein n=1 Tax=Parasponia andersonii TaxID=3476 RepID=A0A2P5CR25_PARAD|nr:Myc-type, basic helix-loop-helix (bHLH) domain containing protein [Parasponia andersonii]
MGQDCGTWNPQLHFNWQSPYFNPSGAPEDLGLSGYMNPGTNMVSMNGTLPEYKLSEAANLQVGQAGEPHRWFYCLPRFSQVVVPAPTSILKEKLPACPHGSCREILKPNVESGCTQKRLCVVDQSGDQTTLIFSSANGASVHCLASWLQNPVGAYNLSGEIDGTERVLKNLSEPVLANEYNENNATGVESEMHEDTEELDALLYSDDDDTTEDDEVTSTGHSPSTMTAHDIQDWFERSTDEVASCAGATKKRKHFDDGYDAKPSLMDTASSAKPNRSLLLEDDAESSCANNRSSESRELDFSSSNKKIRKEKIRETVSILQSIIPDGKGKDAIVVLDEAIQYLKLLKLKAKALRF